MSTIVEVVGEAARDAFLLTVTASSVELIGGGKTYESSSYYTGAPVGNFGGTILPDADVSTGSFVGGAKMWSALTSSTTGTVVSAGSDAIISISSSQMESFEVGLGTPLPSPNTNEIVHVRVIASKTGSAANSASVATMDVQVKSGNIGVTAPQTFVLTNEEQRFEFVLSEVEKLAAPWADLSVSCSYELSTVTSSVQVTGSAKYVEMSFFKSGVIEAPPRDETIWRILYMP